MKGLIPDEIARLEKVKAFSPNVHAQWQREENERAYYEWARSEEERGFVDELEVEPADKFALFSFFRGIIP